ncbi:MAG: hypothetical protein ACJAQ6_001558 [Arenicella sp.]|jgi:hypothetical protein
MKSRRKSSVPQSLSSIKRQGGWTFWSLIFTLSVISFFSYVGMQLVPIYNTNSNVVNAMKLSLEKSDLRKVGRAQIITIMNKQLYLDGSHKLLNMKEDLVIKRSRSLFTMQVSYERRVPIVGNISIVTSFNPKIECNFSGNCTTIN